jgi:hypothetical protein
LSLLVRVKLIISLVVYRILGAWPNTYTLTKALAEDLVRNECKNLPVGVFRPAIVTSTAQEPIKGWIDNLYGPTGVGECNSYFFTITKINFFVFLNKHSCGCRIRSFEDDVSNLHYETDNDEMEFFATFTLKR